MVTGRTTKIAVVCLLAATGLSGCIYEREAPEPWFLKPRSPVSGTEYRLLPPDSFQVTSMHVPEIQGTHRIMPDGTVTFPLLGQIYLADLTPKEVEDKLKEAASKYYEQVDATVTVVNYASQKYYVFGEGGSGPRAWTGRDTLLDALASVTGSNTAWQERVIVIRPCEPAAGGYVTPKDSWKYRVWGIHPDRPDKPRYKMVVNLKAMWQHGDMANNILLKPNDIVYVRPHPFAWIARKIQLLTMWVSPISQAVRTPTQVEDAWTDPTGRDRDRDRD